MISLRNITNAFTKLEQDDRVFLADPWIGDVFDGGWCPYPPVADLDRALGHCDYLYISHIHADHFDGEALACLPRTCTVVIPDIFPNHLIGRSVSNLGFKDIRMVEPFKPAYLDRDLTVEIVPPLNAAQEEQYMGKGLETVAIDTGIMITWSGLRIVLLNDNSPYDLSSLYPHIDRFVGCDLLALNYNGAGDDYPICYRGLSDREKANLCDLRDARKLEVNLRLISAIKPKAIMPYSSEISVRGRQARAFSRIRSGLYNDKTLMAEHLAKQTGVAAFALFEDDLLQFDDRGIRKLSGPTTYPTHGERAEDLYTDIPNYLNQFPPVDDFDSLRATARTAADHMFKYMGTFGFKSEWVLEVHFEKTENPICVDLSNHEVSDRHAAAGRKVLRCFTDARYLSALLHRLTHWNNARISDNLEWERQPEEYEPYLYSALNFFHV